MFKNEKKCFVCDDKAARRNENPTGWMLCQMCGGLLCEACAVYGYDNLPRCEACHFKHLKIREDCQGHIENTTRNECDYY